MTPIGYKKLLRRKPKETLKTGTRKAIQSLIVTLGLMIVILGVIFLTSLNESAQKGYALQQEKLKNEHLKTVNTDLTTKITQATAFSKIEDSEKVDEMEIIEEKNYVTSEDNSVY